MTNSEHCPILGIGNDIIEIERIRSCIQKYGERFLKRLFSPEEQRYCLKYKNSAPHFAGRFSAKEAIVKALGTGVGKHVAWLDIEILNDPAGKPCVNFSSKLKEKMNNTQMQISISHCHLYVTTIAIWVRS